MTPTKLLIQIILATILLFAVFGCNSEVASEENIAKQTQTQKDTTEQVEPQTDVEKPKSTTKNVAPRTEYDSINWIRILDIDPTIVEDMRYATANNFVEEVMYDCAACYLRPEAAKAVGEAHKILKEQGYGGLKMFDCYRPRPIQQKLWDKVPDARYVTPPWKGSMHNKGLAVDLTILDSLGNQLDMGTKFDYFGKEGYHAYTGFSQEILNNRKLLKETLRQVGFRHIRTEWWHYSFTRASYPISDWLWDCE